MKNFFRKKKEQIDEWNPPDCNPIGDIMSMLMSEGLSKREAGILIDCLMGKRKFNMDLYFDLRKGKLRRSLEK